MTVGWGSSGWGSSPWGDSGGPPYVTAIAGTSGPTSGRQFVQVVGGGFRLPPEPPLTGKTTGKVPVTIRVTVGGKLATDVKVYETYLLSFMTPVHAPGVVSVTIENLDDDGNPIVGQSVTVANAFTYRMPDLDVEADFSRLIRTLVEDMGVQVIPLEQISIFTNTDYSESPNPTNIMQLAGLPALVLEGPDTNENRFDSLCGDVTIADPVSGVPRTLQLPYTIDLVFGIMGIANDPKVLRNLQILVVQYFHKNKYLFMDRDPSDASKGQVFYEMDWTTNGGEPRVVGQPNESNLVTFSGKFFIRGFDLELTAGFDDGLTDFTPVVQTTEIQTTPIQP